MGFNSAFKGLKLLLKNPWNGCLNNLNDPDRPQCVKSLPRIFKSCTSRPSPFMNQFISSIKWLTHMHSQLSTRCFTLPQTHYSSSHKQRFWLRIVYRYSNISAFHYLPIFTHLFSESVFPTK